MNRCSFREWIPILPWPVWPLAGQCLLGQKTVVGSMRILLLAVRGNIARRSMSGPRFLYNFTTPRLGVELPSDSPRVIITYFDPDPRVITTYFWTRWLPETLYPTLSSP